MRGIPVDTRGMTVLAVSPVVPRVANRQTGEVKVDAEGRTLYQVDVCLLLDGDASLVKVTLPHSPEGLALGAPVHVSGLTALPWDIDGKSGVAWRCEQIRPVQSSSPAKAA